ncbi:MAG: ABC transporter permease [bacterium]|jgi:ABC-2 type transport system permease protein
MRNTGPIFKRELAGYFNSPIAYIFITVFLGLSSWLFFKGFFVLGQASLRMFFGIIPWIFLFFVPAITMRLWAEERKVGTMELLMTLPVTDAEAVLGKYLASFAFLGLSLALSLVIPVFVAVLGDPDPGQVVGGYMGAVLMGGAFLAIGLFVSSLTENQIVAFIISVVVTFGLFILGEDFVLFGIPDWLVPVFSFAGLGGHYDSISRGVLDSRDIIYYVSIIVFFLYLNVKSIEARK